jgi:hypothetical protein
MTMLLSNPITLFIGLALAVVSASACRDGYHKMCCGEKPSKGVQGYREYLTMIPQLRSELRLDRPGHILRAHRRESELHQSLRAIIGGDILHDLLRHDNLLRADLFDSGWEADL